MKTADYRQGRASTSQYQPAEEREHFTRWLAARPKWAQSLPYSRAVKSAQERTAAPWAPPRLACALLLP